MASDLITLPEWQEATATASADLDATKQAQVTWAITSASKIIRNYLDRDVVLASEDTIGPRIYRYYGDGTVEIDDCTTITAVSTASTPWNPTTRVLDPTEYIAAASSANLPVIDYIELWTNLPFATNPAMGFTWNLDRYGWRPHPVELSVTANWGWPEIPDDIKQAAIWQVSDLLIPDTPFITEAIEGYSHSYRETRGGAGTAGGGVAPITAVTPRAQSVLDPYVRIHV